MRLAVTVACALALHRPFSGRTGAPSNVACLNLRLCICGAMAARCAFAVGASARSCRKSVARVAVAARAVLIEGRTTNPFQTSDARLSLEGADGSRLSAQVLTAKKTVLVFLPVFGTPFAWERVREVELVAPQARAASRSVRLRIWRRCVSAEMTPRFSCAQLRDAGYAVRYVGVGSAGDALKFAERMRLPEVGAEDFAHCPGWVLRAPWLARDADLAASSRAGGGAGGPGRRHPPRRGPHDGPPGPRPRPSRPPSRSAADQGRAVVPGGPLRPHPAPVARGLAAVRGRHGLRGHPHATADEGAWRA